MGVTTRLAAASIPAIACLLSGSAAAGATARCGGAAWAPPGAWGPASTSPVAVAGHPGYRQGYSWSVEGNVPTLVCAQGKGYDQNGNVQWNGLGCSGDGGNGVAPWGNLLGQPQLRARSLSINGVIVSWRC
jgi:hypothetical protein